MSKTAGKLIGLVFLNTSTSKVRAKFSLNHLEKVQIQKSYAFASEAETMVNSAVSHMKTIAEIYSSVNESGSTEFGRNIGMLIVKISNGLLPISARLREAVKLLNSGKIEAAKSELQQALGLFHEVESKIEELQKLNNALISFVRHGFGL